eukprot:scaffold261_cov318-Chaetoceros_neogracile.AAC.14
MSRALRSDIIVVLTIQYCNGDDELPMANFKCIHSFRKIIQLVFHGGIALFHVMDSSAQRLHTKYDVRGQHDTIFCTECVGTRKIGKDNVIGCLSRTAIDT